MVSRVIDGLAERTCPLCETFFPDQRLERHHYEWVPEPKIIRICHECHKRVHHEDGFHDELVPEFNRTEARERGIASEFAEDEDLV